MTLADALPLLLALIVGGLLGRISAILRDRQRPRRRAPHARQEQPRLLSPRCDVAAPARPVLRARDPVGSA